VVPGVPKMTHTPLFPVDGRSDKMTVQKTLIITEVYLFSNTVVLFVASLKLLLERFQH